MFWLGCVWFIVRAFITVAFLYECYTVGLEIYQTVAGEGFTFSQKVYCAVHMWDKWEYGFILTLTLFVIFLWII